MAYLDNNGLSHLWSKIVNLFNKRIEVSETAPTEEENKIWLLPITTNAGAVDYIVEEGISGIWTYRKWNSGIYDAWFMNNELEPTTYHLCSCGTYVSDLQYEFKSPFGNVTSYVGSASTHATWSWGLFWGGDTVSVKIMAISDSSGNPGRCSLHITGTWK